MSFLEIAKSHLITGYPDTWNSIISNPYESEGILDNLDEIQEQFKGIIIDEMKDDYVLDDNPALENKGIRNTYNERLFSEIYKEINIRMNNDCRRLIRGPRSIVRNRYHNKYFILYFTYNTDSLDNPDKIVIAIGREENTIVELQRKICKLIYSTDLCRKFQEFNEKRAFFNNMNKDDIYDKIDSIYSTTLKDPLSLKGKCPYVLHLVG
ncbi:MAG: hypothetical protein H0X50_05985 [Nitrosopumilus sp.]|nr:hypothetical protein [Nitrosopumilus sp.]